ncbi:Mov34/MPN/PAD-1 family protein [Paenibacillus sp. Marseille-P2973]|uniref:Mov34/MPN/PAD-1 family protein n=1 Tax=Paenibacillus sp. Marseille-P2973 TaxID=1871032 RepID=UPI001B36A347|nr:Mov34/MPN/PAD-1 family protein [Paenibacillus sp. Marseille-P2973]MBQ4898651.1 Mov34/MPN/PAD-1 family protein [Paenibacillus sp. Marseille-P2973]
MHDFKDVEPRNRILELPESIRVLLAKDGLDRDPDEACGALFGRLSPEVITVDSYMPLTNMAENPRHTFTFDPAEWVRCCYTSGLIGIFHSHPTSPPLPSISDMEGLQHFGGLLSLYLIGSKFPANGGAIQDEMPPGIPDGFLLNAYSIARRSNGSYFLENLIMSY